MLGSDDPNNWPLVLEAGSMGSIIFLRDAALFFALLHFPGFNTIFFTFPLGDKLSWPALCCHSPTQVRNLGCAVQNKAAGPQGEVHLQRPA